MTLDPPAGDPYVQEFLDVDGYRLGRHVYPDPGAPHPAVLIFPALGTPARFYRPFAQALGEAGLGVVVTDLRGTGASRPQPTRADRYGYADLADDIDAVLADLAPRLAGRPVFLLGHSLGGQLCTLHLARPARHDVPIAGLMLVAVGLPYYRYYTSWPWPRRLGVLGVTQTITAVTAVCRVWPGWGFGGRAARRVMLDWGYTARRGRFPVLRGAPVELGHVQTPVLAVSTEHDRLTPGPSLDALCGMLTKAPTERVHLREPLDHFSWAREPAAVLPHVTGFVSRLSRV